MNGLVAAIVTRCETLLTGLALDDPASESGSVPVAVHAHALPIAEDPAAKAEQAPYLVVRLIGLEESGGKHQPLVRLIGEIYTEGDVAAGMADLLAVVDRLRPLAERGPGNVAGYKILTPIIWQLGDKESGNQPHPFYQFQADLRFVGV